MQDFRNERLLVIAPHSDDEVLGCGGLISKIKMNGGKVFVLIFNLGLTLLFYCSKVIFEILLKVILKNFGVFVLVFNLKDFKHIPKYS